MSKKVKVGFATKLLSNHYYLNEVPVEGKATSKFNFKIGRIRAILNIWRSLNS